MRLSLDHDSASTRELLSEIGEDKERLNKYSIVTIPQSKQPDRIAFSASAYFNGAHNKDFVFVENDNIRLICCVGVARTHSRIRSQS